LTVVSIDASRRRLVLTRRSSRSSSSLWPGSSSPITESSVTLAPSAAAFTATLAAPPGLSLVRSASIFTIGTGASGEIRLTSPNQ